MARLSPEEQEAANAAAEAKEKEAAEAKEKADGELLEKHSKGVMLDLCALQDRLDEHGFKISDLLAKHIKNDLGIVL